MVTMTESSDIDTVISNNARIPDIFQEEKVALFIYDRYEGDWDTRKKFMTWYLKSWKRPFIW